MYAWLVKFATGVLSRKEDNCVNLLAKGGLVQTRQTSDLWDRTWKNDKGEYVVFQWPNKWLIGWAILTMGSLFTKGKVADVLGWSGLLLLAIWAAMEVTQGVNYFRRLLGLIVAIFVIASAVALLQ